MKHPLKKQGLSNRAIAKRLEISEGRFRNKLLENKNVLTKQHFYIDTSI